MDDRSRPAFLAFALLALLALPAAASDVPASPANDGRLAPAEVAASVRSAMDPTADPCQDFYRYACGGWLDTTELPADQARWARSFSVIREENRAVVRDLLEDAAADPGDDPDRRRIGHYYAACMDEAAVEEAGLAPLQPLLDEIAAVDDAASLLATTAALHRRFAGVLFGTFVVPDFKDPEREILWLNQGGLGMPDRDYYVSEDPKKRELLAGYERHVAEMLGLLGEDAATAARHAAQVVAFETELAKASRESTAMRQLETLYHKVDRPGLAELTPSLPWDAYFTALGHPAIVDVSVTVPEFFDTLENLVAITDPEVLRAYLRFQLLSSVAQVLPARVAEADFRFFQKTLQGRQEQPPRWKRCVDATEGALGESVGKLFVARRFAGDSKQVALEMIHGIEASFAENLPRLAWMDDATREVALAKADAVGNKIGYPDAWRDYSALAVVPDSYFASSMAARQFEVDRRMRKVGGPVDPEEWGMTPQMVNAYYNPLHNEIAFPAGILQPPFFHRDFPPAMNYGGVGAVMGHELTHGFDDQGRKFDPTGQLREWWQPEVATRFEEQARCVADLYSGYEVEEGVNVNGALTLGENVADLGGVKQAYQAYRRHAAENGGASSPVDGLTPDQLFFVAYGQVWCSLQTPESLRMQVTTDPHSPTRFRVIGPLSNLDAFAEAFSCAEGTPMNPTNACTVW